MNLQQPLQWALLVGYSVVLLSLPVLAQQSTEEPNFIMEGRAGQRTPRSPSQITSKPILVEPLYRFTASLFGAIKNHQENVIFSPLSIHVALNMLSLGLTKGSQTERNLQRALGYRNATSPADIHSTNAELMAVFDEIKRSKGKSAVNPKLDMINFAIVNDPSVRSEYLEQSNKYYGTSVRQIKSKSDQQQISDEINKWGKEAGFSGNILPVGELSNSGLTLLNGIKVEAFWLKNFHENIIENPGSSLYKPVDGQTGVKALMAHENLVGFVEFTQNSGSRHDARNERVRALQPDQYDDLAGLEFRALNLALRYDISYTIIEPLATKAGTKELANLEEALMRSTNGVTSGRLSKLLELVDGSGEVAANIRMPGFKFEHDIDLVRPLSSIGFGRIFDMRTADLGKLSTGGDLYVDKVKHQAMIEVNEKGIKAAAVTRIAFPLSLTTYRDVIEVNIDNPFIYLVRLGKVPLFVGHFVKA